MDIDIDDTAVNANNNETEEEVNGEDDTLIDSNIEYYYTESESEPEDYKEKEETAAKLKEYHRGLLDSFVKSKHKLRSEFLGVTSSKQSGNQNSKYLIKRR